MRYESVFELDGRAEARLLAIQAADGPVAWALRQASPEDAVARARGYLTAVSEKAATAPQREAMRTLLAGLSVVTNRATPPEDGGELPFNEGVTEAMRALEASDAELPEEVAESLRAYRQIFASHEETAGGGDADGEIPPLSVMIANERERRGRHLTAREIKGLRIVDNARHRVERLERAFTDMGLDPKGERDVELDWEPETLRD